MARLTSALGVRQWTEVRNIAGAIAADNATLTDANIPTATAMDCTGFETVIVKVEVAAGTNPTMTIEALFRDEDAADGLRWTRRVNSSGTAFTTGALVANGECEITVDGWPSVFFRVTAVTNSGSTTSSKIIVRPGKRAAIKTPNAILLDHAAPDWPLPGRAEPGA